MKNRLQKIECDDRKLGIFGGTFNPIHYGHLRAAEDVREKLGLGKIIFIPAYNPPLKNSGLAAGEHRYEMTRLSIESNPYFGISDIECRKPGKSYTVETLITLRESFPEKEFYLILGIDAFLDLPVWRQPGKIMELATLVVISRPGYSFSNLLPIITADSSTMSELDTCRMQTYKTRLKTGRDILMANVAPLDISATTIRRLAGNGKSIKYLLPEKAESYIISNKLYREGSRHLKK